METFDPFANESDSLEIGGLTFENRIDRVSIYGDIDITRDKRGLDAALTLAALVNSVVERLSSEDLPESIGSTQKIDTVKNPFA
jgi:hypothetical protein